MGPSDLKKALANLPREVVDQVLVGFDTSDDAAVYRIADDLLLIQTVDFFPPVVDDPYLFGQIAAANALSDVYAMGGTPITALNLVAFPCGLGMEVLTEILRGGADKVREAGAVVVGGHTIQDPEPKYGLCVTGTVSPEKLMTNAGAKVGDHLVLTKRLGMGILATALKGGAVTEDEIMPAILEAAQLNLVAARVAEGIGVSAGTDVTGFGLLGHLKVMLDASGVGASVSAAALPVWEGAIGFASIGIKPGGGRDNEKYLESFVRVGPQVGDMKDFLYDPQTSGGLLLCVTEERARELVDRLCEAGIEAARDIGEITGTPGTIEVS